MLDRLSELEKRYDELTRQLASPEHASDPSSLASLGRELSRLEPVVSTLREVRRLEAEQAATQELATKTQERAERGAGLPGEFTLRHSITVTDYTVKVQRIAARSGVRGKWIAVDRVERLPLTGLALKILRRADLI